MSLIYISREMVIQWGCSGDFTSNPKYIVVYIYIVIMWVCLKIGDYNPLSASDSFVDILHDLWIDIWCNVIKPSHMPSCSFLFCALDRMRNPPNKSLRKVHIALGCSYQQFQLSFLFSIWQVDRKCRDLQAILESMITSSKVGVLCWIRESTLQ